MLCFVKFASYVNTGFAIVVAKGEKMYRIYFTKNVVAEQQRSIPELVHKQKAFYSVNFNLKSGLFINKLNYACIFVSM